MEELKPVTVTLAHPVAYGDETINELTFRRRVRFADMQDLVLPAAGEGFRPASLIPVIAKLTGVDRQVIMRLEGDDIFAVMAAATPFIGTGLTTPA